MPTARRRMAALSAAAITATLMAGCAHHHAVAVVTTQPASYAPAAYGQQVGNAFDCYYVQYPAEVTSMVAAGLCPANSVPTLMPIAWHEMYDSYYDSDFYTTTYVPVAYRTTYRTAYVGVNSTFYKTYHVQITTQSKNATYKSNTGTIVKGSAIPSTGVTFGGGNARVAPTLGGGNNRNPAPPVKAPAPSAPKAPAGGFGGGNARPNPAPKPAPVVPR